MVISTARTVIYVTQLALFLSQKGPCQPFVFYGLMNLFR